MTKSPFWTPERIEILRARSLICTSAEISLELGTSRNSVIAKAAHLGIKLAKSRPEGKSPLDRYLPKVVAVRAPLDDRTIGFDELTRCTCRWPFGDRGSYRFCGRPSTYGPYCLHHSMVASASGQSLKLKVYGPTREAMRAGSVV